VKEESLHTKLHIYLAVLVAFCLPLARLTPIVIALLFVNWLIEADYKNKFQAIKQNKFALLFIAFYVLHIVGLAYTQNVNSGLFDLQVKFSLFLFPIMLASRPINEENKNKMFYGLIAGGFLSSLIVLTRAIYIYLTTGSNRFFYTEFSVLLHPSYLSMYLNVIIGWLFIQLLQNKFERKKYAIIFSLFSILFFSFIIVLLSSKMGLVTLALSYISFLAYYIISKKKFMLGTLGLLIITLCIFYVLRYVPEIKFRINGAIGALTNSNPDMKDSESTAVRILVWKAANQVVSKNLIAGVGTGDAKDALLDEYQQQGMTGAYEHKLNAHNEFYQVFIALGLIGFLLLLSHFFVPLIDAFRNGNIIYIFFLIIIIFNFLTESMLETEAGVIFFAFFNSLLCFSGLKQTNNKTNSLSPVNH
jgi:O-antigen ligase